MICKLRMSGNQYAALRQHLSCSDQVRAVLALCGKRAGRETHVLCLKEFIDLPAAQQIANESLAALRHRSAQYGWAVVEFRHQAAPATSGLLSRSAFSVLAPRIPDASITVFENGRLEGLWLPCPSGSRPIDVISVAGDDLQFWFSGTDNTMTNSDLTARIRQAFGAYTTKLLGQLSVAVVGCSGTGSLVVEQLARSGVGHLVLVDPKRIDTKNINRIPNSFVLDDSIGRWKVDVLADAIARMGFGTTVEPIPDNLMTAKAVMRVAECDVMFGCVDGAEGRFLMNKLATFYSLPYIDVGVRLDADGHGGVNQICGTVHYIRPGGSSLLSRDAITMAAVQAEGMKRTNPEAYEQQVQSKYIIGVQEDRPAVISVNMHYASLAVIELLARLHSFRVEGNAPFAQFGSSLTDPRFEPMKPDGEPCPILARHVGRGDTTPLLDNPYLSEEAEAA